MNRFKALLIKFFIVTLTLEIILMAVTNLPFGNILVVSLVVTVVSFLVGDLGILPRSNNTAATVADFGLSAIMILMFDLIFLTANISFMDAVFAAAALAAAEWGFHRYVLRPLLRFR